MGDFKNVFKNLRIKTGYTQDGLAEALGLSRSTVSMYETGNREPDFETLEVIADYFNVDMNYLSGNEGENYYTNLQTRQIAQEIYDNKELRILFDASRNAKPEEKIDFKRHPADRRLYAGELPRGGQELGPDAGRVRLRLYDR